MSQNCAGIHKNLVNTDYNESLSGDISGEICRAVIDATKKRMLQV